MSDPEGVYRFRVRDRIAWAAALTKAQRERKTPDEIIQVMKNGNERFRRGQRTTQDYLAQQRASAKGQYPAAVLLGEVAVMPAGCVSPACAG